MAVPQRRALHSAWHCTAPLSGKGVLQIQLPCAGRRLENRIVGDTWSLVAEKAELCTTAPCHPEKDCRQMQEDRQSLRTERAAAAAPWFQAPLGILAAGRHIMTVGHQLYAAQWKRGGTVPESFAEWWRGDPWERTGGVSGARGSRYISK